MATTVVEMTSSRTTMHPKKFAMLAACASMVMLFSGLTSAYVVRQAAGNWLEFQLPDLFFVNTIVIILSSVFLHFSYRGFKGGKERAVQKLYGGSLSIGYYLFGTSIYGVAAIV